jgi:anti-sigma factor RsiW
VTRDRAWDIDCMDLVELVTEYLEGTLDSELRITVDRHLELCRPCAEYVEQMRETITQLGQLPPETARQLPDPVREQLLAAFRAEPQ